MIISASYKTDIPAFYGKWFLNRLRAGFCRMVNPYNRQVLRVPLSGKAVDGFVFWTKNLTPFLPYLEEVRDRGFPFVVQYTINGYPRALEFSVIDHARSVRQMAWLCETFGPKVGVWRYDPVIFTSQTDFEFHRENFASLAFDLEGVTDEVVISFAQMYRKTNYNMNRAAGEFGFTWEDPSDEVKRRLAGEFAEIARQRHMQLTVCSQARYVIAGAGEARCVSASRLAEVAGRSIRARRKGNRPDCACDYSRDIGEYDTCPHGCVYCYAVRNRRLAQTRYGKHNSESEFLFEPEVLGPSHRSGTSPLQFVMFE